MSFPLAITRANGSDTYTNKRAAQYGKRMEMMYDVKDGRSECADFHDEFSVRMQVRRSYSQQRCWA